MTRCRGGPASPEDLAVAKLCRSKPALDKPSACIRWSWERALGTSRTAGRLQTGSRMCDPSAARCPSQTHSSQFDGTGLRVQQRRIAPPAVAEKAPIEAGTGDATPAETQPDRTLPEDPRPVQSNLGRVQRHACRGGRFVSTRLQGSRRHWACLSAPLTGRARWRNANDRWRAAPRVRRRCDGRHARFFSTCQGMWCNLWREGLAVYVSSVLNATASDAELLLTSPQPLRRTIDANLTAAVCAVSANLDSTNNAPYFSSGRSVPGLPPRLGYYVGYLVAREAGRTRSIQDMVRWPAQHSRAIVVDALSSLATCRPAER